MPRPVALFPLCLCICAPHPVSLSAAGLSSQGDPVASAPWRLARLTQCDARKVRQCRCRAGVRISLLFKPVMLCSLSKHNALKQPVDVRDIHLLAPGNDAAVRVAVHRSVRVPALFCAHLEAGWPCSVLGGAIVRFSAVAAPPAFPPAAHRVLTSPHPQ